MNPFEILLSKRMILRRQDPKSYYKVKDELKSIKKIMQEKFGYLVILTPQLIKLEKIPAEAEIWMGIQDFSSIMEYQMFLYVLMFLEDKEIEEQFVLSHLTDFMNHQFEENTLDWTQFSTRRRLIRVLRYCLDNYLLILNDGDDGRFTQDITTEVLYENTGISRYFMRNFPKNIMEYESHLDFKQSDWIDIDEDRGIARRHRVYRQLLLSPKMIEKSDDEDYLYLKNYRYQIQSDFQSYFECDLHVHKSSAYIILDEACRMGKVFPENNAYADLTLILSDMLRTLLKKQELKHDEKFTHTKDELSGIITRIVKQNLNMLPKTVQSLGLESITTNTIDYMHKIGFINITHENIETYPIMGKIIGAYEKELDND